MRAVPSVRVLELNEAPVRPDGDFVLYWMIANRRVRHNFALQRAAWWCLELDRPLLVLEALRCGYPWASDRLHAFILDGMAANAAALEDGPARYYPYVETEKGEGSGLVETLGSRAAVIVTDDYPCFFLPRMVRSAADRQSVRTEAVDANGLLPLRAADKVYSRAFDFRRFLQQELPAHLGDRPLANPLRADLPGPATLPRAITGRWPEAPAALLRREAGALADLPLDHGVPPSPLRGGADEAERCLRRFLDSGLDEYDSWSSDPDRDVTSGLSPYLHFGHVAAWDVFGRVVRRAVGSFESLAPEPNGGRRGWYGLDDNAEAFLDELVTWREIGFNMTARRDDYDRYESLPDWARRTLHEHASDRREHVYDVETFDTASTHDPLWNAAQRQLVREGRIHNYLRMLWGKKILEWSPSPRTALDVMIELNNRYALDGRDPSSYSGIFWVLGRYDRAWGPERPIFGKIRYMSSESTARKHSVKDYLRRFGEDGADGQGRPGTGES